MKDLTLTLNINEVNNAIKALSQLPYAQVHELISKIHAQATAQLAETRPEEKKGEN